MNCKISNQHGSVLDRKAMITQLLASSCTEMHPQANFPANLLGG